MPDPLEFMEFALTVVTKDIDDYQSRADDAKKGFMWRVSITRLLGTLALITVLISATRFDQIALQFASVPVDQTTSNHIGLAITAFALLLGALTVWWARAVRDRGYLRAWVRYSLTAQALRVRRHELDLAWRCFAAINASSSEEGKKVIEEVRHISISAKRATLEETNNWADNATADLGEYLKGASKITETIDEARHRTKPRA